MGSWREGGASIRDSVKAVLQDLMAGLAAILAVVGTAIYNRFVGSDMRALFAMSGVAFFLAGLARPGRAGSPAWTLRSGRLGE